MNDADPRVPPEQLVYARWLSWGTRIALAVVTVSFLIYAAGWLSPVVPVSELPRLWTLPVDEYRAATGFPAGWQWIGQLDRSDTLSLGGIALLGSVTIVCYLRLLLSAYSRGERVQATLMLAQIVVLLVAASGFFAGAH